MNHFLAVRSIARYTLLEALRSRLVVIVLLLIVGAVALAGFVSNVAITETRQIEAALMGSVLRWSAVFVVSLTVITGMVREFNDKGFELILALPLPRAGYYFGKFLGFCGVSLVVAGLVGLSLLLVATADQVFVWSVSLACELVLVCALSLVCMLTLNQTLPAFTIVAAFYLLSRSLDSIQLIAKNPLAGTENGVQQFMTGIFSGISALLPSLDRFTNSAWLVYPDTTLSLLGPVFSQSVIYLVLLVSVGLFDLYRKNL